MRSVGILTFYLNHNYGTSLQCYALKTTIERLGEYKVKIIPHTFVNAIENGFSGTELREKYDARIKTFDKFLKERIGCIEENIPFIEENNAPIYDCYVVGSDTIWNTMQTKCDKAFFLDFVKTEKIKIAYAPSLGVTDFSVLNEQLFREYIPRFDYLSIRERCQREYLERFTDKKIHDVLDPTLLLEREDYSALEEEVDIKEKYILLYLIYDDSEQVSYVINCANRLAIKYNYKVLHFIYNIPDYVFGDRGESFAFASPGEFLSYVKNAEMIFTNSYHGTIFSLIYERKFWAVLRNNGKVKIQELLKCVDLETRILVPTIDLEGVCDNIEYESVRAKLRVMRQKSIGYLETALSKPIL